MKRSIILFICLCSIIIVMSSGLLFDFRFITLLKRIFFSTIIAIMFGFLLGIIIEKYSTNTEPTTQENKPEESGLNKQEN